MGGDSNSHVPDVQGAASALARLMLLQLLSPSLVWEPTAVPLGWGCRVLPACSESSGADKTHNYKRGVRKRKPRVTGVSRKGVLSDRRIMILHFGLWAQLVPQFGSISNTDDAGWGGLQTPRMRSRWKPGTMPERTSRWRSWGSHRTVHSTCRDSQNLKQNIPNSHLLQSPARTHPASS